MFKKNIIRLINKYTLIFFLFLIISIYTNLFSNLYHLSVRPYEERLFRTYGYGCDKYSFGFINKVLKKYIDSNEVHIMHFGIVPEIKSFFYKFGVDKNKKNLLLLGYNQEDLSKYKIYLNEYRLIFKENNCYYYRRVLNG